MAIFLHEEKYATTLSSVAVRSESLCSTAVSMLRDIRKTVLHIPLIASSDEARFAFHLVVPLDRERESETTDLSTSVFLLN